MGEDAAEGLPTKEDDTGEPTKEDDAEGEPTKEDDTEGVEVEGGAMEEDEGLVLAELTGLRAAAGGVDAWMGASQTQESYQPIEC